MHLFARFLAYGLQELMGQQGDIRNAFPQRGEFQVDHVDAVVEILAKGTSSDAGGKIFVGR